MSKQLAESKLDGAPDGSFLVRDSASDRSVVNTSFDDDCTNSLVVGTYFQSVFGVWVKLYTHELNAPLTGTKCLTRSVSELLKTL